MYIHPFVAGIIATVIAEILACFIYALWCAGKK